MIAFLLLVTLAPLAIASGPLHAEPRRPAPESATGRGSDPAGPAVRAHRHMIAAAHPLAAEAGREMLRAGGSAIDAAIAAQLVLNLVEPQSSGLGGGAFILHWQAAERRMQSYDGRETAPATARSDRFLRPDGRPLAFGEAVASGLSVGVPGLARVMELAHRRHGRLPWARLFEPAIRIAESGFPMGLRLSLVLRWQGAGFFAPAARAYFFDGEGKPRPRGYHLKSPELAATLRALASGGADAFYRGAIADGITAAVGAARPAGDMTANDLAGYRAVERPPFCVTYRRLKVCGMGPPSSGGPTVAQTLKLVEPFDLGRGALNRGGVHLLAEAQKLAYADRDRYMADIDFVPLPEGLFEVGYLLGRHRLIDRRRAMPKALPGEPPRRQSHDFGEDATREREGTSHISVVDEAGNAVAMTTTIEGGFGSGLMSGGFLLNNQLTDFSFRPVDEAGRDVANRVEGGKRPRSSMAPTIVLDEHDRLVAVLGSPGGSRIILYVLKALVAVVDWGLDAQAAAALPNFGSRNGPFELEVGPVPSFALPVLALEMRLKGQRVEGSVMTSGLHIIRVRDGVLEGGADPRREGVAMGD